MAVAVQADHRGCPRPCGRPTPCPRSCAAPRGSAFPRRIARPAGSCGVRAASRAARVPKLCRSSAGRVTKGRAAPTTWMRARKRPIHSSTSASSSSGARPPRRGLTLKAKPRVLMQRAAVQHQRRHGRDFGGHQLRREGMLFQDLRFAPAARAVELGDHGRQALDPALRGAPDRRGSRTSSAPSGGRRRSRPTAASASSTTSGVSASKGWEDMRRLSRPRGQSGRRRHLPRQFNESLGIA